MKTAVISDIHGNATALEAVLADIAANAVDRIISLGDNIGYGPEPEKAITLLREKNIPSVIGNHEIGILRPEFLVLFNPVVKSHKNRHCLPGYYYWVVAVLLPVCSCTVSV